MSESQKPLFFHKNRGPVSSETKAQLVYCGPDAAQTQAGELLGGFRNFRRPLFLSCRGGPLELAGFMGSRKAARESSE